MTMTISIDPVTEEQLSQVASLMNSDKNTVLRDLITEGVAEKLKRLAAIQEGLDDIAAGRVLSTEEVEARSLAAIKRGAARGAAKRADIDAAE